ncbi:Alpha/Beta hydrolase protein [Polychytrium aggregatum]|uniref:Alpha/Beta hydrolase protein n=1 Tax=Polychytrium aggregatum TaxID=110093 RepID=UPI0022FF01C2|nr:Alpha/Beta hydrolase protein [Polychytrium aggregatum]KAI9206467.1 Alpha/Beta hydrolase protein [Polychytrium aggregatum]
MLVIESLSDVQTSSGPMRIHFFQPNTLPNYPNAKFPGVLVFTEIYQVTGPLERFCRQIASHGYVVACPESFHEFEPLGMQIPYDVEGTDRGNRYKVDKLVSAYDEDARLALDELARHPNCNGKLGTTGMCLGGHLAFRAALDPRVRAAVCYFATDIHSRTLGKGGDDSLERAGEIQAELLMIWGKQDTHIPYAGRQLIHSKLAAHPGLVFSWCEYQAQHAFIRDELSKGRYDASLARICFESLLELFHRKLSLDLGDRIEGSSRIEHVC